MGVHTFADGGKETPDWPGLGCFVVRFFMCAHWLLVVGRFAEGSFHEIRVAAGRGGEGEQGGRHSRGVAGNGREWCTDSCPGMVDWLRSHKSFEARSER